MLLGYLTVLVPVIAAGVFCALCLWPAIVDGFTLLSFEFYKRRIGHIWRTEVADDDIVTSAGDDCWWKYFKAGYSPREALFDDGLAFA